MSARRKLLLGVGARRQPHCLPGRSPVPRRHVGARGKAVRLSGGNAELRRLLSRRVAARLPARRRRILRWLGRIAARRSWRCTVLGGLRRGYARLARWGPILWRPSGWSRRLPVGRRLALGGRRRPGSLGSRRRHLRARRGGQLILVPAHRRGAVLAEKSALGIVGAADRAIHLFPPVCPSRPWPALSPTRMSYGSHRMHCSGIRLATAGHENSRLYKTLAAYPPRVSSRSNVVERIL